MRWPRLHEVEVYAIVLLRLAGCLKLPAAKCSVRQIDKPIYRASWMRSALAAFPPIDADGNCVWGRGRIGSTVDD